MFRPLAAALTAAALAAPANAAPPAPGTDYVYTVSASHESGSLDATCVFRPDRWTSDHGPTSVDGFATTTGVINDTGVRCRIYSWGELAGDVSARAIGPVALIQGESVDPVGYRPNITICVDAFTASTVIDWGISVSRCVNP